MKLKPIHDRVAVQIHDAVKQTASGLYIPDTATDAIVQGTVIAVGNDVEDVSIGDVVAFNKSSGQTVKLDEEENHVIKEEEIIAVIN